LIDIHFRIRYPFVLGEFFLPSNPKNILVARSSAFAEAVLRFCPFPDRKPFPGLSAARADGLRSLGKTSLSLEYKFRKGDPRETENGLSEFRNFGSVCRLVSISIHRLNYR
jgi:hypothetical protein